MAIGVQEADIWAAADALLQAGEQPTIERVRLHMGRGSPNTVGPHLKTWFRGLGQRLETQQANSSVPEPVARLAAQFWNVALDAARTEWADSVSADRAELSKAQEDLRVGLEAMEQEKNRLRARETDLEEGIQTARAQAASAEERLQSMEAQLRDSQQVVESLRGQAEELRGNERAVQQALREAQLAHQAALAAAQERHTAHERRWLGDLDAQRQNLKKTQEELDQQRKSAAREVANQAETLAAAQKQIQQLERNAVQAQAEEGRLTAQLQAQHHAAGVLQSGLEQRNSDLDNRIEELQAQLRTKDRQIELLMQAAVQSKPATVGPAPRKRSARS
jgi:chromosome segregation ATPase